MSLCLHNTFHISNNTVSTRHYSQKWFASHDFQSTLCQSTQATLNALLNVQVKKHPLLVGAIKWHEERNKKCFYVSDGLEETFLCPHVFYVHLSLRMSSVRGTRTWGKDMSDWNLDTIRRNEIHSFTNLLYGQWIICSSFCHGAQWVIVVILRESTGWYSVSSAVDIMSMMLFYYVFILS